MASFPSNRPLAVVTGASSGIGYELARLAAEDGHDLVVCADRGPLDDAADRFRETGVHVDAVECDLATAFGVDKLILAINGRPVDLLMANAGHGLGHGFLDKPFSEARHVVDTNITGTLDLIHRVGREMRRRARGRILITGSIAGLTPGSFQAVYNGTKAFVDSFSSALRNELKDTGVSVTCLMPGATETNFFARADMLDTRLAAADKASPAEVARDGYEAMRKGLDHVVPGWRNKLEAAMTRVIPDSVLAEQHRRTAEPGTAHH
jgi:short-subunit dehydrogenase